MSSEISTVIERYESGARLLDEAVRALQAPLADRVPAPGKWTIRQIAAHLADSEVVGSHRFRTMAAEPGRLMTSFDQEKWASGLRYAEQPLDLSAATFVALRRHNAAMLRALPEAAWRNRAHHEERGDLDLLGYVQHMTQHAEAHVGQIRGIRENLGAGPALH